MLSRVRRGALLVLLGVGPLVAAYACGDFSGDTTPAPDAGAETAAVDASSDAGADALSEDASKRDCRVHAIATGYAHSCAVFGATKTVACWGDNASEQAGAELDAGALRTTAGLVPNLDNVKQLALGQTHSCALKEDGSVWCWGSNDVGELGNATASPEMTATPTKVFGIANATEISAGYSHTCARLSDATVACWGANTNGQLGDGTTTTSNSPVTAAVTGVVEIGAGAMHACARLADGGVVCWGDNYLGEIGTGFDDAGPDATAPGYAHKTPQKIDVGEALRLGAGSFATCAQFHDVPVLRCWGDNVASILVPNEDAAVIDTPTGVTIPFGLDGGDLTTGGYHTCAVAAEGSLFCWGFNVYGQAGPATVSGPPSLVPAAGAVDHVATGAAHTCTLADASIACFGWNEFGQLGQGTNDMPPDGGAAAAHPIPLQVMLPCP